MTRWVCRYCIALNGLNGKDLENWPEPDDHEAIAKHIESVHHIPVRRDGETERECAARFAREQPEAGGPDCRCPKCTNGRRLIEEMTREG